MSNNNTVTTIDAIVNDINALSNSYPHLYQNQYAALLLAESILCVFPELKKLQAKNKSKPEWAQLLTAMRDGSQKLVKFIAFHRARQQPEYDDSAYLFGKETPEEEAEFNRLSKVIRTASEKLGVEAHRISNVQQIIGKDVNNRPKLFQQQSGAFIGRNAQTNSVIDAIKAKKSNLKIVLVHGATGVGKSSFALRLANSLVSEYSDIHFYIKCRAHSKYPLTTTEAMQQVVKMSTMGQMPLTEQDLVKQYHKVFDGKKSIIVLDDPYKEKMVLELIPRISDSASKVCLIIATRKKFELRNYTKNTVDRITEKETKRIQYGPDDPRPKGVHGDSDDDEDDEIDEEFEEFKEEKEEGEGEGDNGGGGGGAAAAAANATELQKINEKVYEETEKIFGKRENAKSIVVQLMNLDLDADFLDDEGDDNNDHDHDHDHDDHDGSDENNNNNNRKSKKKYKDLEFPRDYHLLLVKLEPIKDGAVLMKSISDKIDVFTGKTISLLCANIPLFLVVVASTVEKFTDGKSSAAFLTTLSGELQRLAQAPDAAASGDGTKSRSKFENICDAYILLSMSKWSKDLMDTAFKLTTWPFSFDTVSVCTVLEKDYSVVSQQISDLVDLGFVEASPFAMRFSLHDLVRETLLTFLEGDAPVQIMDEAQRQDLQQELASCQEKYLQYYFDLMRKSNMEHKWAGCDMMPGCERYDVELENMKEVQSFMKERSIGEHIAALNAARYIIKDRLFGEARGYLLFSFLRNLDANVDNDFAKAEYYEALALAYWDLTDSTRAFNNAKQSLEIKEKAVRQTSDNKENEKKLLCILTFLGDMAKSKEAYDNADKYYERAIEIATKHAKEWQKLKLNITIPDNHNNESSLELEAIIDPYLAYCQIQMGIINLFRGKYNDGKKLFYQGLHILFRIYGEVHPKLIPFYDEYSSLLKGYRKYAEIDSLTTRAIDIDKALFGDKSSTIADRTNQWAVSLLEQGKFADAERLYRTVLEMRLQQYGGDNHENVAAAYNNLAVALKNQNRLEEAEKLYKKSLEIMTSIRGKDHPDVAIAVSNLANILTQSQRTSEAEEMYRDALSLLKQKYGENHELVAAMYVNIGDSLRIQGQLSQAIAFYEQSMVIRRKLCDEKDPVFATSLSNLGSVYFEVQEWDKAAKVYEESMNLWKKSVGIDHPHFAVALTNLANVRYRQERYQEAEELFRRSLDIKRRLNQKGAQLAATLNSLGIVLERLKKHEEAERLFKELLQIQKSLPETEPKAKEETLSSIATNLGKQSKYEEAEAMYAELVQIAENQYGPDSTKLADYLQNLGAVLICVQKWPEAYAAYDRAYTIYEAKNGPDDPKTIEIDDRRAQVKMMVKATKKKKKCIIS